MLSVKFTNTNWHGKNRRIDGLKLIAATAQLAYQYLQICHEEAFEMPYHEKMGTMIAT